MIKNYSELIKNDLIKQIEGIKQEKGLNKVSELRKFQNFTFLFVDIDNCQSITLDESQLKTAIPEDIDITHIVVLAKMEQKRYIFLNTKYVLIGIYDIAGKRTNLEFDNFDITSFELSDNGADDYDTHLICAFNITLTRNPFKKYINKTMGLVQKAINSAIKEEYELENFLEVYEELPLSITYKGQLDRCYKVEKEFDKFLEAMKQLDMKIRKDLINTPKTNNFNPLDYIK